MRTIKPHTSCLRGLSLSLLYAGIDDISYFFSTKAEAFSSTTLPFGFTSVVFLVLAVRGGRRFASARIGLSVFNALLTILREIVELLRDFIHDTLKVSI